MCRTSRPRPPTKGSWPPTLGSWTRPSPRSRSGRSSWTTPARALRHLALDEYTGNGALNVDNALKFFEPQNDQGLLEEVYGKVAATSLIERYARAVDDLKSFEAHRDAAAAAVTQATSTLAAAHVTEDNDLVHLAADQSALQAAGACAGVPAIAAPPAATTPVADVQVTSTAPGPTTTTTTTTTTVPTTTTTTTTTVPTTTTTTTTVPGSPSAPAPAPAPAGTDTTTGVDAIQGCLASLAPPTT